MGQVDFSSMFNSDALWETHVTKMKEQERIAIRALIAAKRIEIMAQNTVLTPTLKEASNKLKKYTSENYVKNIQEGLTGNTAKKADEYLKNLAEPTLNSPIK